MHKCIDEPCSPGTTCIRPTFEQLPQNDHPLELPFEYSELSVALGNVNKKSAPGPDGINFFIINKLPEFVKRTILDIYNDIVFMGEFPEAWRNYLCLFIPKSNNNKVRPISISSCFLKLLEKMINERLTWWSEHNELLNNSHFDFRMSRSCIDSLAFLIAETNKQFYLKNHLTAVFLDIKGAYDNVDPEILIRDLIELKLPKNFILFIYNLISIRYIQFVNCLGNIVRPTFKGLPQGSILSPILFSIYINKVEDIIAPDVKILKFADDIALFSTVTHIGTNLANLEQQIKTLSTTLYRRKLQLAPDKCKLLTFNKSNLKLNNFHIKIEESIIYPSPSVKFLGMVLDRRLNWNAHVEYILRKCEIPIRILCCIRGTWWGADPSTMITMYNSLIRSRIEYGGFLMSPCKFDLFYKIETIQLKCLRLAMGYRNSTPINIIYSETKILSLGSRFKLSNCKFLIGSIAKQHNQLNGVLESISELFEFRI